MAVKKTTKRARPMKGRGGEVYSSVQHLDANPLANWVGYEGGNGKAGLVYLDDGGSLHTMILPNARVRVSGGKLEGYGGKTVHIPYATFGGVHWGFSDAIWNLTDRQIDTFQGAEERYGSPEHVFPLVTMMALNGLPEGDYKLVVTVPPGYFNAVADKVVDGFKRGNIMLPGNKPSGYWGITLEDAPTARRYRFTEVMPVMEAVDAATHAALFDLNGNIVPVVRKDGKGALAGRVTVIDLGFVTADTPVLIDGVLLEDQIMTVSDNRGGILTNMAQPVMDAVIESVPETGKWITPAHVDYWLRRWAMGAGNTTPWSEEAGQVVVMGKLLHLAPVFERYAETYSRYVLRLVIEAINANSDAIFAVGGGWLYVLQHIKRWYKEAKPAAAFMTHEDFPHLKSLSFIDVNLVGLINVARFIENGEI